MSDTVQPKKAIPSNTSVKNYSNERFRNVTVEKVKALAEKWFGDIPSGEMYKRNLPQEPVCG